jgi:hypothetical protein
MQKLLRHTFHAKLLRSQRVGEQLCNIYPPASQRKVPLDLSKATTGRARGGVLAAAVDFLFVGAEGTVRWSAWLEQ